MHGAGILGRRTGRLKGNEFAARKRSSKAQDNREKYVEEFRRRRGHLPGEKPADNREKYIEEFRQLRGHLPWVTTANWDMRAAMTTMHCQICWNPLSSGQEAAWRDDLVHIVCLDCLVDVCRRGELREIDRVDISVVAFLRLYDGQGANREGPASGVITDHQGSPVRVQRKKDERMADA